MLGIITLEKINLNRHWTFVTKTKSKFSEMEKIK